MSTLNIGDTLKVKGPKGAMVYTPNMVERFGMIAGGTGITPMLQIIKAIHRGRNMGDRTEVNLIFANVNEEDILLRKELNDMVAADKKIHVHYMLNNPPEKWLGGVGFVTSDVIKVMSSTSKLLMDHTNMVMLGNVTSSWSKYEDFDMWSSTHGIGYEKGYRIIRI